MNSPTPRKGWLRWRFHLSGLLLVAPVVMAPTVIAESAEMHDARIHPQRQIGPWTVTIAEHSPAPATSYGGRRMQDFSAVFCAGCVEKIRGAFLHVGERPSVDAPGMPLHGNTHHLEAHVEFPRDPAPADSLWLTVDGWDGSLHQISWPLENGALQYSAVASSAH